MRTMLMTAGVALAAGMATAAQAEPITIEWWHAVGGGTTGAKVKEIAEGFNAAQDTYEVKPLRLVFPMRPEAQDDSTGCVIVLS